MIGRWDLKQGTSIASDRGSKSLRPHFLGRLRVRTTAVRVVEL
ncbi:hypothetical protein J2753_001094 [Halolamina salifodinae]|uniref:Uncharacterized protein n=1 Tax=Halolamina salifodinae TaxID=1202767 RepID=A0A8T4GVX4_9EURY|nr:hypothetical protein [Halolamina salifodinae]